MKVYEIYKHYENLKRPIVSVRTFNSNKSNYYTHIHQVFGDKEFSQLKYIDYQNFVNNLLSNDLKPKTIKNILIVLQGLYKVAKINDWYDGENYISFVELPRFDNRRYFTLDVSIQKAYIKAILDFKEFIYKDIFVFLLHGRRLNEVLGLKWEQIDLTSEIMYLPYMQNKARKNLSFKLTDIQLKILRLHYAIAYDRQCTPFVTGYVFVNPQTMTRFNHVKNAWNRLLDNAGLPRMRIHDVRHLVATYLINNLKISIEIVSHLLGHSDIKITQRYINPEPANSKLAMDKLLGSVNLFDNLALGNLPK
ncbi:MAG: tyrosine-type recombinase/integrase [Sulfurovaceae bacterium]